LSVFWIADLVRPWSCYFGAVAQQNFMRRLLSDKYIFRRSMQKHALLWTCLLETVLIEIASQTRNAVYNMFGATGWFHITNPSRRERALTTVFVTTFCQSVTAQQRAEPGMLGMLDGQPLSCHKFSELRLSLASAACCGTQFRVSKI
jgi:hypothetical protein